MGYSYQKSKIMTYAFAIVSSLIFMACNVSEITVADDEGIRFPTGLHLDKAQNRLYFTNANVDLARDFGQLKYFDLKTGRIMEDSRIEIDSFALNIFNQQYSADGKDLSRLIVPTRRLSRIYFFPKNSEGNLITEKCNNFDDCAMAMNVFGLADPSGMISHQCEIDGKQTNFSSFYSLSDTRLVVFRTSDMRFIGYFDVAQLGVMKVIESSGELYSISANSNKVVALNPCSSIKVAFELEDFEELCPYMMSRDGNNCIYDNYDFELVLEPPKFFLDQFSTVYTHVSGSGINSFQDIIKVSDSEFLLLHKNPGQLLLMGIGEDGTWFVKKRTPLDFSPNKVLHINKFDLVVMGQADPSDTSLYLYDYRQGVLHERKKDVGRTLYSLETLNDEEFFVSSFEDHKVYQFRVKRSGESYTLNLEKELPQ